MSHSNIQTPLDTIQQPSLLRLLAAFTYDSFLLFSVAFAYTALYIFLTQITGLIEYHADFTPATDGLIFPLGLLTVFFLFYAWFWQHGGQTLGMRAWRLKLSDVHGGNPSWKQCAIRFIVAPISWALFGLGYFWSWFDADHAMLHDRIAHTRLQVLPKPKK